jgi:hypothetical protein
MTIGEEQLRAQFQAQEAELVKATERLNRGVKVAGPFAQMAATYPESADDRQVAFSRPIQTAGGYQLVNIEVRDLRAAAEWVAEVNNG